MKTTDPRDPLDQKIDQLLSRQPVQAPSDFLARTLAAAEAEVHPKPSTRLAPLIRFALPLAAAFALALLILNKQGPEPSESPLAHKGLAATDDPGNDALTNHDLQVLLLLQEGLSGFAQAESEELNGSDLLDTLEVLYSI